MQNQQVKRYKAVIVDTDELFRKKLRYHLETVCNIAVISEAQDVEFIFLPNIFMSDIIIISLTKLTGSKIEIIKMAVNEYPYLKIIVALSSSDEICLKDIFESGIKGCIFKKNIFKKIKTAVFKVINGGYYISENVRNTYPVNKNSF